ncbi:helix-turn-helix domain-containing protein [Bdellovibrionota bacterium FG-2]
MDFKTLSIIAALRGLNQSDLAALAGVSRQAVSLWAKQTVISLRLKNIQQLAHGLGVSLDALVEPLPILNTPAAETLQTSLLWDHLFPALESFVVALVKGDLRALARLVQVYGLYGGAKTIGSSVWEKFPQYKNFIHPARREQCEKLWMLHENPALL